MSILTGVVIVISMAVLAQRSDSLIGFFTRENVPMISPQSDEAIVAAGGSEVIDVLANDENRIEADAENLRIVVSPSCGAAEATADGVLYISNNRCIGPQLFAYCVARGDECPSASVTVLVTDDPLFKPTPRADDPVVSSAPAANPAASPAAAPTTVAAAPSALEAAAAAPSRSGAATPNAPTSPGLAVSRNATEGGPTPRVGAAAGLSPTTTAERAPLTVGGDAVAASVRPLAQGGTQIRRLADAPRIDTSGLSSEAAPETTQERVAAVDATRDVAPGLSAVAPAAQPTTSAAPEVQARQPDVSALRDDQPAASQPETPPTDVAALSAPIEEDTLAAIRRKAAEDLLRQAREAAEASRGGAVAASRPAATATQPREAAQEATQVVADCGPASVASKAGAGGASVVDIESACRAGQVVEILHEGLSFSLALDDRGVASAAIPVMAEAGGAEVLFEDGLRVAHELNFNWRELAITRRIAVAWTDDVDIDLHAFEYAADFGGEGHVWQQQPRGFRLVRRSGGGYLDSFPARSRDGQSIEVYTFWANSRARRGVARIALDHASRGDAPSGAFCGDGDLASPEYLVVRSERGVVTARTKGRFASAACGASLPEDVRYASGALRDLTIE